MSVHPGALATTPDRLMDLPVRLAVDEASLRWLARAVGVPLPRDLSSDMPRDLPRDMPCDRPTRGRALSRRLSGAAGSEPAGRTPEDPPHELVRLGAVADRGQPRPALAGALMDLAHAPVMVDADVARVVPGGAVTLRAWHRRSGNRCTWLTATQGRFELGWCGPAWWGSQLVGLVAAGANQPPGESPHARLRLPLPLLLASGEAVRSGRDDLLAELLRHDPGGVCAPEPLPADLAARQVRLVHAAVRARLQVTVAGNGPRGERRLGVVSWLRFPDGWRALTPTPEAGVPWVSVEPVAPTRLAAEVDRLVRGVR
jgi:hypothetical protein